jgi:K+ transporter
LDKTGKQVFEKFFAHSNFILLITTAVLTAACLYIIFLYKQRKQQIWLTLAAAGLSIINLIIYFTETRKFESGTYSLTAILALATPVLLALAIRGIWKDEKLVKSVDRLR